MTSDTDTDTDTHTILWNSSACSWLESTLIHNTCRDLNIAAQPAKTPESSKGKNNKHTHTHTYKHTHHTHTAQNETSWSREEVDLAVPLSTCQVCRHTYTHTHKQWVTKMGPYICLLNVDHTELKKGLRGLSVSPSFFLSLSLSYTHTHTRARTCAHTHRVSVTSDE